jgi:hypothetical protein
VGRPNFRSMDGMIRNAERLGVRNWKSKAKDRDNFILFNPLFVTIFLETFSNVVSIALETCRGYLP